MSTDTAERDLLGQRIIPDQPLSEADLLERKRARRRAGEVPRGYYAAPGSGPPGETCGSCKHARQHVWSKAFYKCDRYPNPTKSRRTDILLRSPACKGWEAKDA